MESDLQSPAWFQVTAGMLQVSKSTDSVTHDLYYELRGDFQSRINVLFLHGGPGSGFSESSRKLFNDLRCRVLFFDQRGAGRSTPAACLTENNTNFLVNDIEILREHFNIEKFDLVVGGSWGSTLALAYAE